MREIKFRAWDKNASRIYQVNHIDNLNNSKEICCWTNEIEGGYRFNPLNLEQFTGLHDKNGKEIYEGDIVEFKTLKMSKNLGFENELVHDVVKYSDYSEWLVGNSLLSRIVNDSEVIGNIHENPELLEEK